MGKRGLLVVLGLLAAGACVVWMVIGQRSHGSRARATAPLAPLELAAPVADMSAIAQPLDRASVVPQERVAVVPAVEEEAPRETPAEATVVVRVVRAGSGAPVPGQRVLLQDAQADSDQLDFTPLSASDGTLGDAVRADGFGRCTFRVPAEVRTRAIAVDAVPAGAGREVVVEPLAGGETQEVSLVLAVLDHWIRVEDAADGMPLAGARVRSPTSGQKALTDAQGLAVLPWFAEKQGWVQIQAEGYGPAQSAVERPHESPGSAHVVRLSRTACLRGRVLDAHGEPIADAEVEVAAPGASMLREGPLVPTKGWIMLAAIPDRSWPARTDADGAFTACGLPPAVPLQVSVTFGGGSEEFPDRPQLAPGAEREVVFRLGALPDLEGVVRDESGQPVPDCVLFLCSGLSPYYGEGDPRPKLRLVSDGAGRFAYADLLPGYWCIAPAPESGFLPLATRVHAPAGGSTVEAVVEARVGRLFVAGSVKDPEGKPPAQAHVLSDCGPSGACGSDGSFRIGPFAPGPVLLSVVSFDGSFPPQDSFEVLAGDEELVLQLARGGPVAGRLIAATGEPTAGIVMLDGWTWSTSSAGPDGAFSIAGLHAGTYGLSAYNSCGLAGLLERVQSGEEDLVVRMVPGGRLALRFPPADWKRKYLVRAGSCVLEQDAVAGEERTTHHFPPGLVTVELLAEGGALLLSRKAEVRAGETLAVDLTKEP